MTHKSTDKFHQTIYFKIKIFSRFLICQIVGLFILSEVTVVLALSKVLFRRFHISNISRSLDISQIKKVLIIRLDEIGDIVMTTAFLRELRQILPNAHISLVVKPEIHNLVEICPYMNEVLKYNPHVPRLLKPLLLPWYAFKFARRHLWSKQFDLAILPRWDTDSTYASFLALFSGAQFRIAYSEQVNIRKMYFNKGFDKMFTHLLSDNSLKHEVEHNLDIISFLKGSVQFKHLELWIGKDDKLFAESIISKQCVQENDVVVGFGPSGGHSHLKQWPLHNFVELGHWLQKMYSARIIIIGGPGEEDIGRYFENALGSRLINMVGKTSLRQLAAILKHCKVYIGTDAGPLHVATAQGVPVLALFGSSCSHRYGPWGEKHKHITLELLCNPCHRLDHTDRCKRCLFDRPYCMTNISVGSIQKEISSLINLVQTQNHSFNQ